LPPWLHHKILKKKLILELLLIPGLESVIYFFGEFSPNFYLKNMILTYTKDFSFLKMEQLSDFEKNKFQIVEFLCQKEAKNMERFFFFYFQV
jgi:hypothetical protein